jgi:hypothetical protein
LANIGEMKKTIFLIFLISGLLESFSFAQSGGIKESVILVIADNQDLTYQLPENDEDWFDMKFSFTIQNQGPSDIMIVSPNCYKIFPHPWIIKLDSKVANKWSGSPMCAPSFEESAKIQIKSGESKEFEMYWSYFTESFTRKAGKHELSIKYEIKLDSTSTMGANVNNLSELETEWSNTIEIEIRK